MVPGFVLEGHFMTKDVMAKWSGKKEEVQLIVNALYS